MRALRGAITALIRFAAWCADILARWRPGRTGFVLVYHGVSPKPVQGQRLSTPQPSAEVEEQIAHIARRYRIVTASELPQAVRSRRLGARIPVALTFDDDLRSHLEVTAPILRRHRATATFFLTGSSLERPYRFWWQRLEAAMDGGVQTDDLLRRFDIAPRALAANPYAVGKTVEAMPPERRERFSTGLAELLGPDPEGEGLRVADVRALLDHGFEIGFHTAAHHPLSFLDDDDLAEAMRVGHEALEAACGAPVTLIAYPHGATSPRVAAAAQDAGFTLGFTLEPDPVLLSSAPLMLGRNDFWGVRSPFFEVKTAILALRRNPPNPT